MTVRTLTGQKKNLNRNYNLFTRMIDRPATLYEIKLRIFRQASYTYSDVM